MVLGRERGGGRRFPDLSKQKAFAPYLTLPSRVPEAKWELAMNFNRDDPERKRLAELGWKLATPHQVARTPARYRRYLASASAEFTAIKGVDVSWQTGWVSDRAAAFLALGRPVITEDTGAAKYLPEASGMFFVRNVTEAAAAARRMPGRLGDSFAGGPGMRRGGFRFREKSAQDPWALTG